MTGDSETMTGDSETMMGDSETTVAGSGDGRAGVQDDLLQYVAGRVPQGEQLAIDTDLLETELLDSMLIVDLCAHVERAHGVKLDNVDIAPRNFRTVGALAALVAERRTC